MQIVARQLQVLGIPQQAREARRDDLSEGLAGVVRNSWTPAYQTEPVGPARNRCEWVGQVGWRSLGSVR